ncbi:hypothetical protein HELRODRAFT_75296, partial [Helobdella robusta]|uniref:Selenoprotein T n=1 Tax=Helobdella robusta TaxID=6412 RepID=T1G234_HELRO
GYRKVYDQFAYAIHQRYPDLLIQGDNYPPLPMYAYLSQIIGFVKILFIIIIASGQNPLNWVNLNSPTFITWALENKIYSCMILFFVCNAIESTLISTGAFEISFNDVPVWSKLETGRIPSPQEMFQILDNHMRLFQKTNKEFDQF